MADLRAVDSIIARALEFAILCASRTGEVRFARWSEIDVKTWTWTIPKARMKTRKHEWTVDHIVPLSDAAVAVLLAIKGDQEPEPNDYVFAQPTGRPIGVNSMRRVMWAVAGNTNFKVHGFRSCFSDWAGDCTNSDEETREFCLAHVKAGVAGRYRRSTAVNKRWVLLRQWAEACAGGTVVPFEQRGREAA